MDSYGDICYINSMNEREDTKSSRSFIKDKQTLQSRLTLTSEEARWQESDEALPLLISSYYLSLINPDDPDDPIRKQVVPSCAETVCTYAESTDPQDEKHYSITNRLIRRYRSRAAFLVTDTCATYCRYCFRRRFSGGNAGPADNNDIVRAAEYLAMHPQVKELLLTGGDLFTLSDKRIDEMITIFRTYRTDLVIRLCSRIPVTYPMRVTDGLIEVLKKHKSAPIYLFTQFNHPREITKESTAAIACFVDAGIPAMNQTVLLKGINDSVDTLVQLMQQLVSIRVKPYYLFQGDLVGGTSHFRVPLERGLELEQALRQQLSGLAMPVYAVDLPEGGGKVPLGRTYLEGRDESGAWIFRTADGDKRTYVDP